MDCSLPGSSVHGIFQVRILEWGAIALSGYADDTTLMAESEEELKNLLIKVKEERASKNPRMEEIKVFLPFRSYKGGSYYFYIRR